jgi:hypothetical protein
VEDGAAPARQVDKTLLSSSLRRTRVLIWIGSLPLGILTSAFCAYVRIQNPPLVLVLAIGLVMWPIFGFLFDRIVTLQSEAFDAVFSGDYDACRRVLAKRAKSTAYASLDVYGTAALEIALGDPRAASLRIASIPRARIGPNAWMTKLIDAHILVASANPVERAKALGQLLSIRPTRKWAKRYRAYLFAQAALHEPVAFVEVDGARQIDVRAIREHDELCRRAVAEIRAYADPVAVHFARFIEAARRLDDAPREPPALLRASAQLARGFGVVPIAEEIELRATEAERAEQRPGPYRA